MRTTVTIDPDVEARLRRLMRDEGLSFKEALNRSIRRGLEAGDQPAPPFRQRTFRLGPAAGLDLDRANRLADALEDEELVRKLARGA